MNQIFENRKEAGVLLSAHLGLLSKTEREQAIILALPRGGVPVAYEVSQKTDIPFDVLIVRKIGHPLQAEYGIGAIAEEGFYWMDPDAVGLSEITKSQVNHVIKNEKKEVERRINTYRGGRPLPSLDGKTVILIDDGLATGVTARVAAQFAKAKGAAKVILAVPVCSERTAERLRNEVDQVICLNEPSLFLGVGQFYRDFKQLSDNDVLKFLSNSQNSASEPVMPKNFLVKNMEVVIPNENGIQTKGFLNLTAPLKGIVIFAHGSGSGRFSTRNQQVASYLNDKGIGTLLFDLLTEEESQNRANVFDIPLLAKRLISATKWIREQEFGENAAIGFFGASTGGGAALWAAAELKNNISAVVSRGGRPDLAKARLKEVTAPTLLVVGDQDIPVIPLSEESLRLLKNGKLTLISGATHLFEEPGTLDQVCEHAAQWFLKFLAHEEVKFLKASENSKSIVEVIEENATPLRSPMDLAPLIEKLSKSKVVMLGESSHGTQEFYEWRRIISQELISRHGFNFIAVEGDWPPSAELNRFIHSETKGESARMTLRHFQRWPTWMWANTEVMELSQWMKEYNKAKTKEAKAGFFGLDVYSLFESIDEVLKQLQKIDPVFARRAQIQYECFDPFQRDEKLYAKYLAYFPEGCEIQVLNVLKDLLTTRLGEIQNQTEELFDAEQNARIVKNAERYYRTMIRGDENSWNIRDRHMIETLEILLRKHGPDSKAIVWAHNTHIGDYRATDMVNEGQINIGGLAREKWGEDKVSLIGFGTYQGEVIASHAWDGPVEIMTVPPGRSNSYEAHFHSASQRLQQNSFYIWLKDNPKTAELAQVLGHRAIGVVYHPAHERFGNYVPTSLSHRYDGFVFIDHTKALTPFIQKFVREEIPETWPRGM